MKVVHYIDRNLLYIKIKQIQPLPGFRTKENPGVPAKRSWLPPILAGDGKIIDSVTLNEITLEHLDELIEKLQEAKENFKKHNDN